MPLPPLPAVSTSPGFPSWYRGGWVDVERLLIEFFGELLTGVTTLTWLPPEKTVLEDIQNGTIYLRIFRTGGRIIRDQDSGDIDRTHVQFAAISASRDLSWEVIEFVRNVLYSFDRGGSRMKTTGLYAVISCNGEIVGPALTAEAFRDPRLVPVTFELDVQRRKGLPAISDYGADLHL